MEIIPLSSPNNHFKLFDTSFHSEITSKFNDQISFHSITYTHQEEKYLINFIYSGSHIDGIVIIVDCIEIPSKTHYSVMLVLMVFHTEL